MTVGMTRLFHTLKFLTGVLSPTILLLTAEGAGLEAVSASDLTGVHTLGTAGPRPQEPWVCEVYGGSEPSHSGIVLDHLVKRAAGICGGGQSYLLVVDPHSQNTTPETWNEKQ